MRFLKLISFLISVLFCFQVFAVPVSDSLLLELKSTPEKKEKSLLFNTLSRSFKEKYPDSSFYYAKKGFDLAIEIEYNLGIAENAASIADYYVVSDSLYLAREYYTLAAKHFEELEMDFDFAQVTMVLGNIYLSQFNYSEALAFYQKSLLICEAKDFKDILPHLYNNIGLIYSTLGEKEKAIDYLTKAFKEFKGQGLKGDMASSLSNIAAIYLADSKDSLAISYFKEALEIFKENGSQIDVASMYLELGNYEYDKGNYNKALDYYEKANSQNDEKETGYHGPKSRIIVGIVAGLGRVHSHLGHKETAIKYLEESLLLAEKNNYIKWIEICSYELSAIYEEEGDFGKSLEYFKMYEEYGDSILNESSIKKITQLEMQFEFDEKLKEKELEDTRKENAQQRKEFIYILIIVLGISVSIVAILLFVNQKSKTTKVELKNQNLKLEHEKLQQELIYKNKELATNVMYLVSKNEFITSTAEKLSKSQLNFKKENQKLIQDIVRDLLLNSSKDVWKEFEVRFQEVHSSFYGNLMEKFPDLTPNEKKICAFLRLNMSTKDISAITYQSVRSIDMARFRLRKKMQLDSDENLVNYLSQF